MAIADLLERDNKVMPLVRFTREAVENKAASLKEGRYVAVDVDYALVTPPFSKDVMKHKLPNWFDQLAVDANAGRVPREWVERVKQGYEAFKRGQELPLDGTPIRGWGVISPAQQETLIRLNILTVETLSQANDEGLRRIGMGAHELKNKAIAWLKQLKKAGAATQEIAALQTENAQLKATVATLEVKLEALAHQVQMQSAAIVEREVISAADFLDS